MAENLDDLDVSSMSNFENASVLVVDNNAVNLKLIECWLKSSSCKVTAVDSGLRALQFLRVDGLKMDLIIIDYCMPDMNGYELLQKIKESPNFKEVPVVIISSDNVSAHINMCLNEGAVDFLSKPMKISDIERLSLYMNKGRWRSEREWDQQEKARRVIWSAFISTVYLTSNVSIITITATLSFEKDLSSIMMKVAVMVMIEMPFEVR